MKISSELLAAYAAGNVSKEERIAVRQYLIEHQEEMETVLMMDDDYDIALDEEPQKIDSKGFLGRLDALIDSVGIKNEKPTLGVLPMTAMAAENSINTLCAIRCEGFALRYFGFDVSDEELIDESRAAGWLKDNGTALHNIGRLSGSRGLSVAHCYDCSIADIKQELKAGRVVVAVVDKSELNGDLCVESAKDTTVGLTPDHAVVVKEIDDCRITIIDSSTPQQIDTYTLSRFEHAWDDSSNYLIVVSNDDEYEPHPIDLSDVDISNDLIELREAIAENAHEVWAANRKREGWTYGPVRDDVKRQHPDMKAYNRLPDSEKVYDREMAMNTIKLVKKLGYDIVKRH